jgi:hypothetical protein
MMHGSHSSYTYTFAFIIYPICQLGITCPVPFPWPPIAFGRAPWPPPKQGGYVTQPLGREH